MRQDLGFVDRSCRTRPGTGTSLRFTRGAGTGTGSRQHVAVTLGTNLVLAALNAGTGIILAHLLGPEGRGSLQAVQLWGLFLGLVAALGVPEAVTYFSAKNRSEAGTISVTAMVLGLASSVVFMALGWVLVPVLLGGQDQTVKQQAQWFLLIVPVYVVMWMAAATLRGMSSFGRWNLVRISPSFLWLVVVAGAWLSGHFTVAVLAGGMVVAFTVQMAVNVAVVIRSTSGPYRVQTDRWRPMLRFGLPTVMGSVPQTLNLQLDQFLLVAFVPTEQLGLYVVAVAWAGALAPALHALGAVLFPRVASEASELERLRIATKGFRLSLVVSLASVATLLVLTVPVLPLVFGTQFQPAVPAALILVVAAGVRAVSNTLQEGFRGLGRPAEVLWSELVGLFATGVLLAAMLPTLGILGAALASLGGYAVTMAVLVVRLGRTSTSLERPNIDDPSGQGPESPRHTITTEADGNGEPTDGVAGLGPPAPSRPMWAEMKPGSADVREVIRGAASVLRR